MRRLSRPAPVTHLCFIIWIASLAGNYRCVSPFVPSNAYSGVGRTDGVRHANAPPSGGGSYTAAVAYDPERRFARTTPDLAASNLLLYRLQMAASLFTFCLGIQVGISAVLLLLPSILSSRRTASSSSSRGGGKEYGNISSVYGGSRTAILALWGRSQMSQMSGGPDNLAPKLLEKLSPFGPNVPASVEVTAFCAFLSRINFQLTRGIFEDQAAFIATLFNTGLVTPMHVRTCWLDDCVETFVRQISNDSIATTSGTAAAPRGNLVILGSGFDTRCYRLNLKDRNVRMFEVDAPGTQAEKKRVLREAKIDASGTTFCPCDFEAQDWFECLESVGLDALLPTMVVWEGVTMYLPKSVVVDTLKVISGRGAPWKICFDYIDNRWAMSPIWRRAMKRLGEPFKFAMTDDEPEQLVQSCGLQVLEHLKDEQELARRYQTEHFDGNPIGIMGEYGGFVVAGVEIDVFDSHSLDAGAESGKDE